ncbi:MAG: M24 family metallopeptidase [Hyphomicrobiaceae bacterium]
MFQVQEFEARLSRLHAAMHRMQLDAVLFMSEAEIRYFTGFRTQFWQSPTRPWFLIVPASAKPIAVIPEIGANLMRNTWIDDIRTWPSPRPDDDGISLLAAALEKCSRIGLMMGPETELRMPLANFETLRERLRHSDCLDVSEAVRFLRMVKSPAEITLIENICKIASASFARAPELFRAGQSLSNAFKAFKIELLQQGAEDVPYLVGGAGPGGYPDIISPPGDQALQAGDVLMLDTGATLQGYFCDFDRNFAIGRTDAAAEAAYERMIQAAEAAFAAARPGMTCKSLHRIMADVLGVADDSVGRYGHGLGMQLTEPPSLAAFDETVLAAGMVITLEPSLPVGDGRFMVHEENIVIRDGPAQMLTRQAPGQLPVV